MLQCVLELDDVVAIRLLIGIYGLDINATQDADGNALLHLAVKAGNFNRVKNFNA